MRASEGVVSESRLSNISEYGSEQKKEELPGVFTLHLLLTTKLVICGFWLPSASTVTFKDGELSPRNFLTHSANRDTFPPAPHPFPG